MPAQPRLQEPFKRSHFGDTGGDDGSISTALTLNPGDHVIIEIGQESSNEGGYNGATGTAQPGDELIINGLINGTEAVNLSVFDRDVHSGIFRTNPFGVSLDNYVLQGGDPVGRDTGDGFETTQTPGFFQV
jgi:hypothetical protein